MKHWFNRHHWPIIFAAILLVANTLVWYAVWRQSRDFLTVAFLDIGQGDAIFIEAPNGNQVLIDGGPGRAVLRALSEVMPFYDRSIDLVLATHPDADHIGGLPEVLERFLVGAVMESGVAASSGVYDAFQKSITDRQVPKILARRGERVNLGRGAILEILFPDRDPTGWETNTASIVAKLTYGENEFLLTGDSPIKIEKYLLGLDGRQLQADVLKAGHHGSKTSTAREFAMVVQPDYAIISAGKNNRYGHPHQEVLDILRTVDPKMQILRTDEVGTIIFESDGVALIRR